MLISGEFVRIGFFSIGIWKKLTSNIGNCANMMAHDHREHLSEILTITVGLLAILVLIVVFPVNAQSSSKETADLVQPKLQDPNLKVELVSKIPNFPTNMAFIGPDDILMLSKNDGEVLRIKDGKVLGTVLRVNVTSKDESGLLGI